VTVAIGQLLDEQGLAMQISRHVTAADPATGRNFDVETRKSFRATPAHNVRSRQGERIPVNIGHHQDAEIGNVVHLEMAGRHLWAVAELDHDLDDDGTWKFSVETTSSYERGSATGTDIEITGIGIVTRTAQTNLQPIQFMPGSVETAARRVVHQHGLAGQLVRNAANVLTDRRHNRPIQVRGLLDADQQDQAQYANALQHYYRSHPLEMPQQQPGEMRISPWLGKVLSVR
jgi:hypothetical protein